MRLALLLMLLPLVSCRVEDEKAPVDNPAEETVRYEPITVHPQGREHSNLTAICNALSFKEGRLSVLASSQYTFKFAQKGCKQQKLGSASDVRVTLQRSGNGDYVFRTSSGDNFAFADVETRSEGVMAEICDNLDRGLTSPMQISSREAIWFTTFNTKHCTPDADHLCVAIKRGGYVRDHLYAIHTSEWIKFKINKERRGFFVERRLASTADCALGQTLERSATLLP